MWKNVLVCRFMAGLNMHHNFYLLFFCSYILFYVHQNLFSEFWCNPVKSPFFTFIRCHHLWVTPWVYDLSFISPSSFKETDSIVWKCIGVFISGWLRCTSEFVNVLFLSYSTFFKIYSQSFDVSPWRGPFPPIDLHHLLVTP